jgi:hypothetical protein
MAISSGGSVLSSKPKPVMTKTCCELSGVWDGIRRFNDDNSAEDYSG